MTICDKCNRAGKELNVIFELCKNPRLNRFFEIKEKDCKHCQPTVKVICEEGKLVACFKCGGKGTFGAIGL